MALPMWNPSWKHSCDIPRTVHMRPAFDDGMLSDRSRMRLLYCTPPDQPGSGHIGPDVAASVVVAVDAIAATVSATVAGAATVTVAALAAVAYHPAKKTEISNRNRNRKQKQKQKQKRK